MWVYNVPDGVTDMGVRKRNSWPTFMALLLMSASVGVALVVDATTGDIEQLPVATRFGCQNCHFSSQPTGPDLNPFGVDFRGNNRVWNADLAQMDSDDDGCLNGVELGDSDGDGQLDGNIHEENGNPGVADDCGSGALTDEVTWGALKALFSSR